MTHTQKKLFQLIFVAAMIASTCSVVPSASAVSIGPLYDGTNGDVACTTSGQQSGFFTIERNVVTSSSGCLGSVTIPQGVTRIGNGAFRNYGSTNITSLTFPNTVTSVGEVAFDGSISTLQTLVLPSSLRTIEAGAFINAQAVTTLVIPNGVTSIPVNAFNGMYRLTSLTLPTGLHTIGAYAFANAGRLTSLSIPNGVTAIGEHAFREAVRLTSLTLPSTLTTIGGYAFHYTNSLTTYQYCGSLLTDENLAYAWLGEKTKICTGNSEGPNSEVASTAATEAAKAAREAEQAAREAEQASTRTEIVNSFKGSQTISAQIFAKAGIPGVTESNISDVNAEILALPKEVQGDLNQILKIARKYEVVSDISSENVNRVLPNTFIEVGLIPADSLYKTALAIAVRSLSPFDRDSYAEIKAAIVAKTAEIQARKDRLAKVLARPLVRNEK